MLYEKELVTIEEAARLVGKLPHNIRYYLQYKRINKYNKDGEVIDKSTNGELRVCLNELKNFLNKEKQKLAKHIKADYNEELSFFNVPEYQRTKHVHRLHPYLGKFIPQLVEWFFRKYFKKGQYVLDPFMGSGTTLVQALEMGINSLGIDISPFNCLISKVKTDEYNVDEVKTEVISIRDRLKQKIDVLFSENQNKSQLELFTSDIISDNYKTDSEYLNRWFAPQAVVEMLMYKEMISDYKYQDLLKVLLSRAVRSSRLVPHNDLARPKEPLKPYEPYWCDKHKKYCIPISRCYPKIHMYSLDTVKRIAEFSVLRQPCYVSVIQNDSRLVDIGKYLPNNVMLDGIFTSPPYVGQIDYHEQHIYAYELFGFERFDELEIGPKKKGQSKQSQKDYIDNISSVLTNVCRYLKREGLVFIVANDKFGLYPIIAKQSNLTIIQEIKRAVTKRTEKGDDPYHESIFIMVKN